MSLPRGIPFHQLAFEGDIDATVGPIDPRGNGHHHPVQLIILSEGVDIAARTVLENGLAFRPGQLAPPHPWPRTPCPTSALALGILKPPSTATLRVGPIQPFFKSVDQSIVQPFDGSVCLRSDGLRNRRCYIEDSGDRLRDLQAGTGQGPGG